MKKVTRIFNHVIKIFSLLVLFVICTSCNKTKEEKQYNEGDIIYNVRYSINDEGVVDFSWEIVQYSQ